MHPTPEEFVNNLIHAYDPQKAHEYYLRTRELKGRSSSNKQSLSTPGNSVGGSSTLEQRRAKSRKRREATEERVAQLKSKLERLDKILAALVAQSKARSGVEPDKKTDSKSSSSTPSSSTKPRTAAEKRADAKRAKEYREKNPDTSSSKSTAELEAKIREVQKKIEKMRAEIAAAKSASTLKTAPKGR